MAYRFQPILPLLLGVLLLSCAPPEDPPAGPVRVGRAGLLEGLPATLPEGLSLEWVDLPAGASLEASGDAVPDLLGLGLDDRPRLAREKDSLLQADRRTRAIPGLEKGPLGRIVRNESTTAALFPAAAYAWGLFYRPSVLAAAGLAPPKTWEQFQSACVRLKAKGIEPVALGAAFGWPATAWLDYLDLRMNGAEAHAALIQGSRSFEDPSFIRAIDAWRDFFRFAEIPSDVVGKDWPEALQAVLEGRAGFTLIGGYAWERAGAPTDLAMIPFPDFPKAGGKRGELGQIYALAVPATARNPRGAVAAAKAFIAEGSPGLGGTTFRVPSLPQGELSAAAAASASILKETDWLLPALERWASPQFAQEAYRLFRAAAANPKGIDPAAFAARLQAARAR